MLFELVTLRNVSGELEKRSRGERAFHYPSIYPSFYPSILLLPLYSFLSSPEQPKFGRNCCDQVLYLTMLNSPDFLVFCLLHANQSFLFAVVGGST